MPLNTNLSMDVIQPWTPEEPDVPEDPDLVELVNKAHMRDTAERMKYEPFAKGDWLKRISESKAFFKSDAGPIESAFLPMFSRIEKAESFANPEGGGAMGIDPHYDARQTYLCLAKIVDTGPSRVGIVLETGRAKEVINVDIISFEGKKAWCLNEKPREPIIFLRCTHFPGTIGIQKENPFCKTDPWYWYGIQLIKCVSREEMAIHLRVLRENALNISSDLKAKVNACVDKSLLDIPTSFTTFFTLLLPDEVPKPPRFCRVCGAEGLKTCSKCKVAKYCGKECQVKDWKAGHRRECRQPEEVAIAEASSSFVGTADGPEMWVDIDPGLEGMRAIDLSYSYKEPDHKNIAHAETFIERIRQGLGPLDDIKRDKIMIVKVQTQLGSTPAQRTRIFIYPQGKRFDMSAFPENMGRGFEDYSRLHNLITTQGTDSGLGMGGCKAFLDAYVTSEGKLRVMTNKVKPLQNW